MAGEWIAYDLALPDKPEVQELIDITGCPVEVVVYRLLRLWGWAALNTADGHARMTVPRLSRTCGGDDAFWRAVAAVGWLELDETAATVAIPGWDRRFSQAAKTRLQDADRKRAYEERNQGRKSPSPASDGRASPSSDGQASEGPTARSRRGDRGEVPPPPREASQEAGAAEAAWPILRAAWNKGTGRPWRPSNPPDHAMERLAEPGWLEEAMEAIQRLPRCRYFKTPVTLPQLVSKPGFARDVAGGKYDDVSQPRGGGRNADDRPQAQPFVGDAAARFEATKRALADKLRAS